MNAKDIRDWGAYLSACTPRQLQGVYTKERTAGKDDVAEFVKQWAAQCGVYVEDE